MTSGLFVFLLGAQLSDSELTWCCTHALPAQATLYEQLRPRGGCSQQAAVKRGREDGCKHVYGYKRGDHKSPCISYVNVGTKQLGRSPQSASPKGGARPDPRQLADGFAWSGSWPGGQDQALSTDRTCWVSYGLSADSTLSHKCEMQKIQRTGGRRREAEGKYAINMNWVI